jgi:hypothetical protein
MAELIKRKSVRKRNFKAYTDLELSYEWYRYLDNKKTYPVEWKKQLQAEENRRTEARRKVIEERMRAKDDLLADTE